MANAKEMMLCWNPGTDQVILVRLPDKEHRSAGYSMTSLGCWVYVRKMSFLQRKALVFIEALHLIVRDKCDPLAVHRALCGLEEYLDGCAADMPEVAKLTGRSAWDFP